MPTLLEQKHDVSNPAYAARVLQARHRWLRWRGVLLTCLIGLAVTLAALAAVHFGFHVRGGKKMMAGIWAVGLLVTALAAAIVWWFAKSSLADTALSMDRALAAKNRLETAAAWQGHTSPLAVAQAEETAAYLQHVPRARQNRALQWLAGAVAVLVAAHLILALLLVPVSVAPALALSASLLPKWAQPAANHPDVPPPASAVKLPEKKGLPFASIVWKSPEAEFKANPIEEVPTVATANSASGLKDLTLEISVNGDSKKSVPLPAKPFDQAGINTIKVSIYLDELSVEPFDVVSYFIRGHRITDLTVPDTTSSIQFIQVRKFRDDVTEMRGGVSHAKVYALLIRLKLAQLRSIKENFILAHTDLAVTDPVRMKENDRVGKNEGELAGKTEEVVQAFIVDGASPSIVDLLRQAESPMMVASQKILANENEAALVSQQKALSLIIEVEKFFHKIMARDGHSPSDNPDDPFKDKQKHELKKRYETAAGQIDQLLKNQTNLANDLSGNDASSAAPAQDSTPATNAAPSPATAPGAPTPGGDSGDTGKIIPLTPTQADDPFGPDSGKGTFPERQARVVQGIEVLLDTNKVLPAPVAAALQDGLKDTTASLRQLDQQDNAAAREPATAAVQDLQRAIAAMEAAGQEATKLAMEDAQQQLNDLAQQLRELAKAPPSAQQQQALADLKARVQDIQQKLEDAADQQQQTGSANGAQRLNQLANQITTQNVAKDLEAMSHTGFDAKTAESVAQRLELLGGQAAKGMANGPMTAQEISRLINSLETSRANLARLAQKAGGPIPTPGSNPSQAPQPGAQPSRGQGQKPGTQPGQGQSQTPGTQPSQDQVQGQTPGTHPGQSPGQGQAPGTQPGQGQGQGQSPGQGDGGGGGNNPGGNGSQQEAYREILTDVKNMSQQTAARLPEVDIKELERNLDHLATTRYVDVSSANVVTAYEMLSAPLDKLISDLRVASGNVEREDVVKQPELDEAPPAYRPAVSDYFEHMSRDYHPASAQPAPKKP